MQIRRVTALIDTDGRDISGNRVNMMKNTSHLVSEVDIEYYLSRPLIFVVSSDIEIATYAFDTLGNVIGVTLPNGTTTAFGLTTVETNALLNATISPLQTQINAIVAVNTAQQTSLTAIQATNASQDTVIASIQTVDTNQDSAISAIQTVNTNQSTLITALQAAVAALQAGGGTPTFTVSSVSSPTANEGANLIFTIALTGTTQQAQVFAFTVGGTAIAGTDYASPFTFSNGVTITGSNLNVPIGVLSFTATSLTSTDALTEVAETVILTVGGVTGTGTINDVVAGVAWDGGATTWDGGSTTWTN